MRLGQLARKLTVRQSEVIEFLQKNNIAIEESSNARVDDEYAKLAIGYFAPHLSPQAIQELLGKEPVEEPSSAEVLQVAEPVPTPQSVTEPQPEIEPVVAPAEATTIQPSLPETIEVIKAPKMELPGLKVVGKIELPQPKKKEEPATSDTEQPTGEQPVTDKPVAEPSSRPFRERAGRRDDRDRRKKQEGPRKNPIAQQREREAREAEKKKQREEIVRKERRTNYYSKRIKQQGPTKAARLHQEDVEHLHEHTEQPQTAWGKFLKWFWRK